MGIEEGRTRRFVIAEENEIAGPVLMRVLFVRRAGGTLGKILDFHARNATNAALFGAVVELADADQLFDHPRHPYTGALLSAVPVPDPRMAREKQRQVLGGDVPSPTNPPPACRFHTRCPKARDGVCNVDEPLLEVKDGGNIAACHFPLTGEEIAKRVPTAAA